MTEFDFGGFGCSNQLRFLFRKGRQSFVIAIVLAVIECVASIIFGGCIWRRSRRWSARILIAGVCTGSAFRTLALNTVAFVHIEYFFVVAFEVVYFVSLLRITANNPSKTERDKLQHRSIGIVRRFKRAAWCCTRGTQLNQQKGGYRQNVHKIINKSRENALLGISFFVFIL